MSVIYRALKTIESADGVEETTAGSGEPESTGRSRFWMLMVGVLVVASVLGLWYGPFVSPTRVDVADTSTSPAPTPVGIGYGEKGDKGADVRDEKASALTDNTELRDAPEGGDTDTPGATTATVAATAKSANPDAQGANAAGQARQTEAIVKAAEPDAGAEARKQVEESTMVAEATAPVESGDQIVEAEMQPEEQPAVSGSDVAAVEAAQSVGQTAGSTSGSGTAAAQTETGVEAGEEVDESATAADTTAPVEFGDQTEEAEVQLEAQQAVEAEVQPTEQRVVSGSGRTLAAAETDPGAEARKQVEQSTMVAEATAPVESGDPAAEAEVELEAQQAMAGSDVAALEAVEPVEGRSVVKPEDAEPSPAPKATKASRHNDVRKTAVTVNRRKPKHFVFNPTPDEPASIASGFGLNPGTYRSDGEEEREAVRPADTAAADVRPQAPEQLAGEPAKKRPGNDNQVADIANVQPVEVQSQSLESAAEIPPQPTQVLEPADALEETLAKPDAEPVQVVSLAGGKFTVEAAAGTGRAEETTESTPVEIEARTLQVSAAGEEPSIEVEKRQQYEPSVQAEERQQIESVETRQVVETVDSIDVSQQVESAGSSNDKFATITATEPPTDVLNLQSGGKQDSAGEPVATASWSQNVAREEPDNPLGGSDSDSSSESGQISQSAATVIEKPVVTSAETRQQVVGSESASDESGGQPVASAEPSTKRDDSGSITSRVTSGGSVSATNTRGTANPDNGTNVRDVAQRIRILNADLSRAIQKNDKAGIENIIESMQSMLGEDSLYMLKVRAFSQLALGGDVEYAMSLLREVLVRDPGDREAGLNMAVAEINLGEITQAKSRLKSLASSYPGDERINDLLRSIQ